MTRRWAPVLLAGILSALLAASAGLAADRLTSPRAGPAPHLKTVPATTLTRLGITLASAPQPPYCGLAGSAISRGWLSPGSSGCAISQASAEAAARQGGRARVLESVLARITSTRSPRIGRGRPAWLVVLQSSVVAPVRRSCLFPSATTTCQIYLLTSNRLVLVDATSGSILSSLSLGQFGMSWPAARLAPGLRAAAG